MFIIGNKKFNNHKTEEALLWFDRACKLHNCSPRIKNFYAYTLLMSGDVEQAEKTLNTILESNFNKDKKQQAKLTLSLLLWKKGNLDTAIELLEDMYKNYKSTVLYQNLGYFYILKGDYDKALQFNLEAYDYNSADSSIMDNLAQNYYFKEDYDKALELYEKIAPLKPTFVTYYYYYGLTLLKKNNLQDALKAMKDGLSCNFSYLSLIEKEEIERKISEIQLLIDKTV